MKEDEDLDGITAMKGREELEEEVEGGGDVRGRDLGRGQRRASEDFPSEGRPSPPP